MKNIDKFNPKRCIHIITQDLAFNRKRYILFAITCIAVMQLPSAMMLYYSYQTYEFNPNDIYLSYDIWHNAIGSLMYFGLFTMAASNFASSLNNKKKNYTFLMQPTTVLEKIVSYFAVKGLGAYLILELSILLEIASFQFVKDFFPADMILSITKSITGESMNIRSLITEDADYALITASNIAALFSAYFLGSTVWKKGAWIKTSIAGAVVILTILRTGLYHDLFFDNDAVIIATTIFTIVAWFIIYHIIKRKQIA